MRRRSSTRRTGRVKSMDVAPRACNRPIVEDFPFIFLAGLPAHGSAYPGRGGLSLSRRKASETRRQQALAVRPRRGYQRSQGQRERL